MGYGKIVSGGTDGRYVIELDFGKAQRDAQLAKFQAELQAIENNLAAVQAKIVELEEKEAPLELAVEQARAAYIESTIGRPPGSPPPSDIAFRFALQQLRRMQADHEPVRILERKLRGERVSLRKLVAQFEALNPVSTRSAWCADLTEDGAPGSYVGTIEINGESDLVLIQPGARGWMQTDGTMRERALMSPAQAYLNAAILPGWQKFRPTYRWGTITAINDTHADVDLADAVSSAQRLGINAAGSLSAVPVVYMQCNAGAFKVGDRVVVEFTGQNQQNPRIIGFLDNPRGCEFVCVGLWADGNNGINFATFKEDVAQALNSPSLDVRYRLNSGTWKSCSLTTNTANGKLYTDAGPIRPIVELPEYTVFLGVQYYAPPGSIRAVVSLNVSPPWEQLGDPTARNIAEFVIYIGGQKRFNAAVTDEVWAGLEGIDIKAKGPSGIRITPPLFGGPVLPLSYTLTA